MKLLNMKIKPKTKKELLGISFVLPTLIFIIIFGIIPIFSSIKYSFTDWDGIKAQNYIGFTNYIEALFKDEVSIKAIFNTLLLTFVCVLLNMIIGFSLANLLFRMKGRLAEAGKMILFIPYILSFAAVGVLFSFIFSSTDMGLLNKFLSIFKIESFPWFGSIYTAMPSVIFSHMWKDFGFSLLLYYAGLQSMPLGFLEAAEIDGASEWEKTRYVKLPYLKPITQTVVILAVVRYMLTFTMIMFLTPDGGPSKSTEVVATWFYKQSFNFFQFGYGTSLAIILAIIVTIITIILRKTLVVEEM